MINNPRPTRAETSDVANAIIDGTDAVMLSAETAIGQYPVQAVETMAEIAVAIEASGRHHMADTLLKWPMAEVASMSQAIGAAVAAIVKTMPIKAVWIFTHSGSSARLVTRYRPDVPLLAFTASEATYRRLSLVWGIIPFKIAREEHEAAYYEQVVHILEAQSLVNKGDTVIQTGGPPFGQGMPTNFLRIRNV